LGDTDREAESFLDGLEALGVQRGPAVGPTVARVVQSARAGETFDGRKVFAAGGNAGAERSVRGMVGFVGSPDTVVKQLKAFHEQCGVGVVDLAFQQPGIDHKHVMKEIELFGREVLPRIKEF
jgi:alkanesulfonate monooxygenase SsuD/methylene tetrahydromethanopterin reductase-like flavin-dependent oxidoreductase (luciferase family)